MNDKIFCFQCHNSVYRVAQKGWLNTVAPGDVCLYCYKFRRIMDKNAKIGDCKYVTPESLKKLENGVWKANVANAAKPQ